MKKGVLLGLLLTVAFGLHAQIPQEAQSVIEKYRPEPDFKTPNVAGIEKYGNYEVNLYTGLPQISVPIYTVNSGSLTLPISLSYHASGFKYTDQASWVGMGWSLMAGGQISRSVMGLPDERTTGTVINDYSVDWTNLSCDDEEYKQNLARGFVDREPDIFSYSFPGGSGKYLNIPGEEMPYMYPFRPLKITHDSFDTVEIRDENGILYRFGKDILGNEARDSYSSGGGSVISGITSTWHLTEIIDPNKDDFIRIEYRSIGNVVTSDLNYNITVIDNCFTASQTSLPCPPLELAHSTTNTYNTSTQMAVETIYFKTGKVEFVADKYREDLEYNANYLEKIEIYEKRNNGNYDLIKKVELGTSYFNILNQDVKARLKLDGLKFYDGSGSFIKDYCFEYHTDFFSWDVLQNSVRRDMFGFYNGNPDPSLNTLIPQQTIQMFDGINPGYDVTIGSNRYTDTTFLREGVIRAIHYPTGGKSEFEFEPHRIQENGNTLYIPGLRIRRIKNTTDGSYVSKRYEYGTDGDGFGKKNFELNDFHFRVETLQRSDGSEPNVFRQYRSRMFFSNSAVGFGYEDSPVNYPIVSEYMEGDYSIGKTIYEFDKGMHIGDPAFAVPYSNKVYKNSMSWARGKLTKKTVFDASGNPVSETEVEFYNFKSENREVGQGGFQYIHGRCHCMQILFNYCSEAIDQGGYRDGFEYQIWNFKKNTGLHKEIWRKETKYSKNLDKFTTAIYYEYDSVNLLVKEERVENSQVGIVKGSLFSYPHNLIGSGTSYTGQVSVLKGMVESNLISIPIERLSFVQHGTSPKQVTGGEVYSFSKTNEKFVRDSLFLLETSAPLELSTLVRLHESNSAMVKDTRFAHRLTFDSYTGSGHIRQYSEPGGMVSSFLWNANNSHPIAKVANATIGQIAYTSFEDGQKGGWNYSGEREPAVTREAKTGDYFYPLAYGAISRNVSGASVSSPFRLTFWARSSGSSPVQWTFMGETETLEANWKLVERTVTNSSLSISGQGIHIDEIRIGPEGALFSTYTHRPLLGVQDEMDASNRGMKYIYDRFGRLESVLDDRGELLNHYEYSFKHK